MVETFLKTEIIENNDFLSAISNIFSSEVDADFSGDNEKEFWTEEAKALNKTDKQIVEELLSKQKFNTNEELIEAYIEEYKSRYGNYYDNIVYNVCYDYNNEPISLSIAFVREN